MLLNYRRLDPAEAQRVFPKRGQMDLSEYEEMLTGLQIGDAMQLDLDGVSVRAMKRRVTTAAKRVLDLPLRFEVDPTGQALMFMIRPAKRPRAGSNALPDALPDALLEVEVPAAPAEPAETTNGEPDRPRGRRRVAVPA